MSVSQQELERFARELAAEPERWRHLVRHSDEDRVYAQIWDDEDINAWVICWTEGQDTGFHDHDRSTAAIMVTEGYVREERMRFGLAPEVRMAGPGESLVVPATAIHRVLHAGRGPAVTIHAYSPPLLRTGAYRVGTEGALERASLSYQEELSAQIALG
jgi:mannose-6-phosphate isomerase-like protein (cupin superfamily)